MSFLVHSMSANARLLLHNYLPSSLCKELEFIHKSCGAAGYRPFVLSTTLLHLVATNCSSLIMPFIPIREKVKELVEEHYGCEFELFVEFTGLISWTKEAKIGWHSDRDRPYLKQRHYTAVCYLNSHEIDFSGGLFHFKEGVPATVVPSIGDVLIYRADDLHCVDKITDGERCTLALWFTLDSTCDEDTKILGSLALSPLNLSMDVKGNLSGDSSYCDKTELFNHRFKEETNIFACSDWYLVEGGFKEGNSDRPCSSLPADNKLWMPFPASSSMYLLNVSDAEEQNWTGLLGEYKGKQLFLEQILDSDLRIARAAAMGFEFCICTADEGPYTALEQLKGQLSAQFWNMQDILDRPVKLKFNGHEISYIFANSIHALQVIYFAEWMKAEGYSRGDHGHRLRPFESGMDQSIVISDVQAEASHDMYASIDAINEKTNVFESVDKRARQEFSRILSTYEWGQYMLKQWNYLVGCYPVWKSLGFLSAFNGGSKASKDPT